MQSYLDRTFCPMYLLCKSGVVCKRALTGKVRNEANALGLPICQFSNKPDCFKAIWEPEQEAISCACGETTEGCHKMSCECKGDE